MYKFTSIIFFSIGAVLCTLGFSDYLKSFDVKNIDTKISLDSYFDEYRHTYKNINSDEINNLYSEKEITLKDPPVSEVLQTKIIVKVRSKPISPKILLEINENYQQNNLSQLTDLDLNYLNDNKKQFVKIVLPIILNENQKIILIRDYLKDIRFKLNKNKTLTNSEINKLNNLAKDHSISYENKHKLDLIDDLLINIDIIPNSIALAQAAIESGWGTSRFATQHNALFGEYTYNNKNGVKPLERENGEKHLIKSFSSYDHSVESYFNNINSHYAYLEFRNIRKIMRQRNNFSNTHLLINQLNTYAEDSNYINTITAVIDKNKFKKFDSKIITY